MVKIDIEMPTYCYDCPCHNGENGRCNITGNSTFDKRPFDCPLKEEKSNKWMSENAGIKMRPVDADNLLWCCKKRMDIEGRLRHRDYAYLKGIRDCIREIENAPTIEPEQEKGKWIDIDAETYMWMIKCDQCGHLRSMMSTEGRYPKFCENCGAAMGVGQ